MRLPGASMAHSSGGPSLQAVARACHARYHPPQPPHQDLAHMQLQPLHLGARQVVRAVLVASGSVAQRAVPGLRHCS
jgi:hypothetical protein